MENIVKLLPTYLIAVCGVFLSFPASLTAYGSVAFFFKENITFSFCRESFTERIERLDIQGGYFDSRCFAELPQTLTHLSLDLVEFKHQPQTSEAYFKFSVLLTVANISNPYDETGNLVTCHSATAKELIWSKYIRIIADRSPRLQSLSIQFREQAQDEFGIGPVEALLIGEKMPSLKSLSLVNTRISDFGAIFIAKQLTGLEFLDLTENKIALSGINAIAQLSQLIHLNLSDNFFDLDGIRELASGKFSNLRHLLLAGNQITKEGAEILSHGNFPELIVLNLDFNSIGSIGAKHLTKLKKLTHIHLRDNNIGPEGAIDLSTGGLANLAFLDLSFNKIGQQGGKAIAQNLNNLKGLYLSSNEIGSDATIELAENLTNISELDLSGNRVDEQAALAIVSHLESLTVLKLNDNNLNNNFVDDIVPGDLKNLKILELRGNNIDSNGAMLIQEKLPQLKKIYY